jgi:methylated-DNA-[protein]-cysteine S-methyltransferase
MTLDVELSVLRDADGKVVEVFFDEAHERISYEELSALTSKDFRLLTGTAFQKKVWLELPKIPRGTTISYQEMARRVGSPKTQQAVGQALAKNPLPVILPCHRVLRKDGSLGGFMGIDARTDIKQKILDYEMGQESLL